MAGIAMLARRLCNPAMTTLRWSGPPIVTHLQPRSSMLDWLQRAWRKPASHVLSWATASVAAALHIHSKSLERRQALGCQPPRHDLATLSQCAHGGIRQGAGMARIVNDFLLFSCLVAFVWGLTLAAAILLI
jgi:hypothetical protein